MLSLFWLNDRPSMATRWAVEHHCSGHHVFDDDTGRLQCMQTNPVLGMSAVNAGLFSAVRRDPYMAAGRAMPVEMIGSAPPEQTHCHGSDVSAVRACASDGHVWLWRRRIRHGGSAAL